VIRSVLSMVDIDIDFLPSKSTAANITNNKWARFGCKTAVNRGHE
jgi:hypothetical protein